jgi:hypothetical protein
MFIMRVMKMFGRRFRVLVAVIEVGVGVGKSVGLLGFRLDGCR